MTVKKSAQHRPRVVIVGGGFAGLSAARELSASPVDIVLIDKRNYHLFQPLLYQVATAGLSPAEIAAPIRAILSHQPNVTVLMSKVAGVNTVAREVLTDTGRVGYDHLVLATGARHAYFGRDDWAPYAPGLKKIEDATAIRRRVLVAFERAEASDDPIERQALLTFVVIGGGPTGVEMAGAIAELARTALAADFRRIEPGTARVMLVEAGTRVLATFPEQLSQKAKQSLEQLGVTVLTGKPVEVCDSEGVVIAGTRIRASTLIWAAGVAASPAAKWINAEKDRAGRAIVGPDLTVPGHPEIFAIGDTAMVRDADGKIVPGIAPAAKQQGVYAARVIAAKVAGRPMPPAFRYRHLGSMATIGRKSAVVDFGWMRLSGFLAWLLWGLAHVYFLIGFRSRVVVALNWIWAYVTFQRGARLITGGEGS
ncbi:MAG: NAD(P)/FAD-dependent oxidoreductase [Rhodospirillales bacterium]|nr:NAD(P)/FAD-dependent oxidoreductase [Rhodospirillales bacterium]